MNHQKKIMNFKFLLLLIVFQNCFILVFGSPSFQTDRTLSKNFFLQTDTFVTKKQEPKKAEIKNDSQTKLEYQSLQSIIASGIGLGALLFFGLLSIFFFPFAVLSFLSGTVGVVISTLLNKTIKKAIKNKEDLNKNIKDRFLLSKIFNIISVTIMALLIILTVALIVFFIILLGGI